VSGSQGSVAPAVTVIIPTRNRADLLLRTIRSALQQTIPVEILVMDDGSSDDTARRVAGEFPAVFVHRQEASRGPAWQRNRGAELSSTPVLVTLDDDCELVSRHTLFRAIEQLKPPRVGAVTIPFINIRQNATVHSAAPEDTGIYCTAMYFGGMVAFKRAAYQAVKGYRSWYFMHVEEPDLALRMLNAGFVVRLGMADPIHHHESPTRNSLRLHELGAAQPRAVCVAKRPDALCAGAFARHDSPHGLVRRENWSSVAWFARGLARSRSVAEPSRLAVAGFTGRLSAAPRAETARGGAVGRSRTLPSTTIGWGNGIAPDKPMMGEFEFWFDVFGIPTHFPLYSFFRREICVCVSQRKASACLRTMPLPPSV
jgi:GT2 family glycosyltransferase